jgi:hypothetical protein
MTTTLICFILGVVGALAWVRGVMAGTMLGLVFGFVHRSQSPMRFWLCSVLYGALVCSFVVMPILKWAGLRG